MELQTEKIRDRNFLIAIIVGFLVTTAAFYAVDEIAGEKKSPTSNLKEITFTENGSELASIQVEVAETRSEKEKGLMNRENLAENRGMIFVYGEEANRIFWMKNTLIPLDIIFVTSDRKIANIEQAYPEPGVPDSELERYSSEEPVQYVIEANLNFSDRHGIDENSSVKFNLD